jgi:hypothetical protein
MSLEYFFRIFILTAECTKTNLCISEHIHVSYTPRPCRVLLPFHTA